MNEDDLHFPMLVSLRGRKCVVIGAGRIAEDKISTLVARAADVVVVSPRATRSIRSQALSGALTWHCREFSPEVLEGAFLAVAATSSLTTNTAVFQACRSRGILCNAVDDPEHCDFIYPAVVRRGRLQIAISTGGSSPALAGRLRRELEQQFGPEWGTWVEHLRQRREELLARRMSPQERRSRLLRMVTPEAFRSFAGKPQKPAMKRLPRPARKSGG